MMNQPSEHYPNFFPTVIPSHAPAGLFAIPPPPDFSTIVPPTKKLQSNGVLIALLAIFLVILYKCWKKEVKESQKHVEQHEPNRVRSSKNGKKINVHERDMPVYGYNKRRSKSNGRHERDMPVYGYNKRRSKSNGRLREARYGKKPKRNHYYDYDGDLESEFDDMYSSSGDESNFYLEKLVINAKHVTKSNAYKGEGNTSSKPETTHNGQIKEENTSSKQETTHNGQTKEESAEDAAISNDIELSILLIFDKVDTKSNAYEGEEDVHSETEKIHDRQSEQKLAKDSMRSDAPESDLESALGETGSSKSKHETIRPGKHKKGKGRAR